MTDDAAWTGPEPAELIDRLARRFIDKCGSATRDEIISVIEMLIDNGNLEMARVWTRVTHASHRLHSGKRGPP
jgi:hypothetical protein